MHRYSLRYTQDLAWISTSDDAESLKRKCDYLIHIWDHEAGKVIWQNGPSVRYGDTGVCKK